MSSPVSGKMSIITIAAVIFSIVTASLGQIFLKKGSFAFPVFKMSLFGLFNFIVSFFSDKWLLSGTLFFIVSFFSYVFILSKLKLSFAYPLTVSAGLVLVAIGSQVFLGEKVSLKGILGIVLIIIGIFLISSK